MIMDIIAYAALIYLVVQAGVVILNLVTWPVLPRAVKGTQDSISVLVPARNEERNIGRLLDDLSHIGDQVHEILVYDDESSDSTPVIVEEKALNDQRIRLIRGFGPVHGWLGKNHACHELARIARGDLLLFLDADVRVGQGLISDSAAYLEQNDLALLSLFPVQQMRTPGEWMTVPLMNRILLGNLPLVFIKLLPFRDFSAANGQFMLFRGDVYRCHQFHQLSKDERVEDIRIMQMIKQFGFKTMTLLSNGQIACRMYAGLRDGIQGFSKNIHAFFGKRWLILFLYTFFNLFGPIAVSLAFSAAGLWVYLAALMMSIMVISLLSKQNILLNLLLYPIQQIVLLIISLDAVFRDLTGTVYWKGRRVK
jgi:chlorobactene glucosyltransferase